MACTTVAKLTRFVVRISEGCGPTATGSGLPADGVMFKNCIKVTGLSLGEEGTVTVPQWGVNGMLADGQRTLSNLTLDFRVEDSLAQSNSTSKTNLEYLVDMYQNRGSYKYDIEVAITDRAFKALFIYKFEKCDMRTFKSDDQEFGAAKLGTIMTDFLPLDVQLLACNGTNARITGREGSNLPAGWSSGTTKVTC